MKVGTTQVGRKQTTENFSMPLLGHSISSLLSLLGNPADREWQRPGQPVVKVTLPN